MGTFHLELFQGINSSYHCFWKTKNQNYLRLEVSCLSIISHITAEQAAYNYVQFLNKRLMSNINVPSKPISKS